MEERPGTAHMLALAALDLLSSVRADAARQRHEGRVLVPLSHRSDLTRLRPTPGAVVAYA